MKLSFSESKNKALENLEVREEYESLAPAYALRKQIIKIDKDAGFTQEELAEILAIKLINFPLA